MKSFLKGKKNGYFPCIFQQDFRNFVKLTYMSKWLHHSGGTICEPTDVPVNKRHLDRLSAYLDDARGKGAEVIVPNAHLVSEQVMNWTLSDPRIRIVIEVGIAYGSDARRAASAIEEILLESEEEKIDEARILVSAGRGCQDQVNLDTIRELARKLGGTLAGSRAIVELGWIPHSLQVGQSGTTVGPELYIAIGISGGGGSLVTRS